MGLFSPRVPVILQSEAPECGIAFCVGAQAIAQNASTHLRSGNHFRIPHRSRTKIGGRISALAHRDLHSVSLIRVDRRAAVRQN